MKAKAYTNQWIEGTYEGLAPVYSGLNDERFKFNDIKLFASMYYNEAANFKDHRTVFDRNELTYLCVAVQFKNKWSRNNSMRPINWKAPIILRCLKRTATGWDSVCSFDMSREIRLDEDIVELGNSWGMAQPGGFWQQGEYCWETWIDNKLLVLQYFYINDIGAANQLEHPYFTETRIQFFKETDNGNYYTILKQADADNVKCKMVFYLRQHKAYFSEFFIDILKDGQPWDSFRTEAEYITELSTSDDHYLFKTFPVNPPGITGLSIGQYDIRIHFLGMLLCSARMEITEGKTETGEFSSISGKIIFQPATNNAAVAAPEVAEAKEPQHSLDYYLQQVDELIGMDQVKKKIKDHIKYVQFIQLRRQKGFEENTPILLHSVFTGNPGTGKTTVIRLLGNVYKAMGLLSKGHVVEADRALLVGEFIGQTAPKTKAAIETARGGILFIDEAYSLARKGISANDFGLEAIEILLKEMTTPNANLVVMCAGYPKEMAEFLDSNPGLKSRFLHYYEFADYTPAELLLIADYTAGKMDIVLPEATRTILLQVFTNAYRSRDKSFGNARFVNNLLTEAKMNLAKRLMNLPSLDQLTDAALSTIEPEDVQAALPYHQQQHYQLSIDEDALQQNLQQLNGMIGLQNIKDEINDLVKLIRYYQETGQDFLGKFSLHAVFSGNPGTGKTTVARIIAGIYKALGLLERGHLVEVDREALVAGYIGQTATKTADKINEALGGILFIDEAYSLATPYSNDFGPEAIQTLLKRMEDLRGQFAVIVAGYEQNMQQFISTNPGLQSRFDKQYNFNDYNAAELYQIALNLFAKDQLTPDEEAAGILQQHFENIYRQRDQHFGNARLVRQLTQEVIRKQNLRMASTPAQQRNSENIKTIIAADLTKLIDPQGPPLPFASFSSN